MKLILCTITGCLVEGVSAGGKASDVTIASWQTAVSVSTPPVLIVQVAVIAYLDGQDNAATSVLYTCHSLSPSLPVNSWLV